MHFMPATAMDCGLVTDLTPMCWGHRGATGVKCIRRSGDWERARRADSLERGKCLVVFLENDILFKCAHHSSQRFLAGRVLRSRVIARGTMRLALQPHGPCFRC